MDTIELEDNDDSVIEVTIAEETPEVTEAETAPVDEEAEEQPDVESAPKTGKREWVKFDTPEQQKAYNDIYKQVKMSDTRNQMLLEQNQGLLSRLEEVEKRFAQTDHAEAENILMTRLEEARESGDDKKADAIMKEIIAFQVEEKLAARKPAAKATVAQTDPKTQQFVSYLENYATEKDDTGRPVRPWMSDAHPLHNNALKLAAIHSTAVLGESGDGQIDIEEVMNRVENDMNTKPAAKPKAQTNSRMPDPNRGSLTNKPTKRTIKLSVAEQQIAHKLGMTNDSYAKAKMEYGN